MKTRRSRQDGNVLFIILIAIALFAALTYAVVSSTRYSGQTSKNENAGLAVSVIESYAASIRAGLQRIRMTNSCGETDLSFYHPGFQGASDYSNPADKKCHVFDAGGAAVIWQKPPPDAVRAGAVDYLFTGSYGVWNIGLNSCSQTELMMFVRVSSDMCVAYNKKLGITNPAGNPPGFLGGNIHDANMAPPSLSKFGSGGTPDYACGMFIGDPANAPHEPVQLVGRPTGCYQSSDGDKGYFMYFVLLTR